MSKNSTIWTTQGNFTKYTKVKESLNKVLSVYLYVLGCHFIKSLDVWKNSERGLLLFAIQWCLSGRSPAGEQHFFCRKRDACSNQNPRGGLNFHSWEDSFKTKENNSCLFAQRHTYSLKYFLHCVLDQKYVYTMAFNYICHPPHHLYFAKNPLGL